MATRVIPEFSVDGQRLAMAMREVPVDGVISYADLSALISRNVQREGRSALMSARRQLQRDERMIFDAVKNVGIKRLTDSLVVSTSQSALRHINRTSRKGMGRLVCVDYQNLTREEMVRHNTSLSLLSVFYEVTKVKSVRQIECVVAVTQKVLRLEETLELFRVVP
jgi:hypothetical protein